ncbi:MAG TPA: hypothetical protein DCP69_04430 [Candidatus Omnitrophica bacterium]|nr:hypothetical protein [Candidatus Omnitrophota bacterium]
MSLTSCPKCGAEDITTTYPLQIAMSDSWIYAARVPAECNHIGCDQRFWWYPASGRITRRSK